MLELWKMLSGGKRPAPRSRQRLDLTKLDPGTVSIYVLPDIHGCLYALHDAEERIMKDLAGRPARALLIYLGDYIDRGPESAQVLDHLTTSTLPGTRRVMLCGNHDDLFVRTVTGRADPLRWLEIGGRETLESYGIDPDSIDRLSRSRRKLVEATKDIIPPTHIAFLQGLPVSIRIGFDYLFVHAGILPGRPLAQQTDEHMMWIREPFISTGPRLPLTVIHGHTIVPEPFFSDHRIALDTGAYMHGRLEVLKIAGGQFELI